MRDYASRISERAYRGIMGRMIGEGFRRFSKPSYSGVSAGKRSGGYLEISYAKSEKVKSPVTGQDKEQIIVALGHVWKDGAQTLVDSINSSVPRNVISAKLGDKNDRVYITVSVDAKNEIPTVLSKLEAAIKDTGEYNERSVEKVCSQIYDTVDSVATEEDMKNADTRRFQNWKDMLQKLQDPEVRQRLLRYQTSNTYAKSYGHVLSANNVREVLDQCPTASFVVQRSTWQNIFNRQIKPGAQRIVVVRPIKSKPTMADLDAAAISQGFKSYYDAKAKLGSGKNSTHKSTQWLSEINNIAQSKARTFQRVIMYDVADTIPPSDPALDVWTNQIGLSDNITGILNDRAQAFDDSITSGDAKARKDANKEAVSKEQAARWMNRKYTLIMLCKQKNIDVEKLKGLPDNQFIAKASYEYAKALMPSYGIIHPTQVEKISGTVAVAICFSSGCDVPPNLARFIYSTGNTSDAEYKVAATIAQEIIPSLSASVRTKKDMLAIANETKSRIKSILMESGESYMTPAELFKRLRADFWNDQEGQSDEETDAMLEAKRYITRVVREEIRRQRNRRR